MHGRSTLLYILLLLLAACGAEPDSEEKGSGGDPAGTSGEGPTAGKSDYLSKPCEHLGDLEFAVGEFRVFASPHLGLKVWHSAAPGKILYQTEANRLVALGEARLSLHEHRGSFEVDEEIELWCDKTYLDDVACDGDALAILGDMRFGDDACDDGDFELRFEEVAAGQLQVRAGSEHESKDLVSLVFKRGRNEGFFGFGEQFTHLNHAGQQVPILVQEQGIGRGALPHSAVVNIASPGSGGHAYSTYYAVPHTISDRARSFFLENTGYSVFDLRNADWVKVRAHAREIVGRIVHGDTIPEHIRQFTELTGRMPEPPTWLDEGAVVAVQGGSDKLRGAWQALSQYGTPISAFWTQDWVGRRATSIGSQLWWSWSLDRESYPDWEELVSELHSEGIRILGYVNPFLVDLPHASDERPNLYAEALGLGHLVMKDDLFPFQVTLTDFPAAMVDLTSPEARTWIKDVIKERMVGAGFSGWMADFGEALPIGAKTSAGRATVEIHNTYPEMWAEVNRELIEEEGRLGDILFFTRAGFTRSPASSTMFWGGDQMVTWDGDDGLQSAVKGLLSGGFSGAALNHFDAGGYTSASAGGIGITRGQELLKRWVEVAAFTAMLRTHEGNQPEANAQVYDDDEKLRRHFAHFAKVYKGLAFYRRELFKEAAATGMPVVRHPVIHYPDDDTFRSMDDDDLEFLLGSDLLVAPVLTRLTHTRKVYLPRGRWMNIWTEEVFGKEDRGVWLKDVEAKIGLPPVYARVGTECADRIVRELSIAGGYFLYNY